MINIQRLQVTQSAPVLAEKLLLRVPVSVRFSEVPRMLWALDTRTVTRLARGAFWAASAGRCLGLIAWCFVEGAASAKPLFKLVLGFLGWRSFVVVRGSLAV